MLLALSSCTDNRKDLEAYVAEVKKTAAGSVEKLPPAIEIKPATYTADNLRSPFVAGPTANVAQPVIKQQPKETAITQTPRPDADRPREYLEQFPLAVLSMVGTLSKPHMNWGLVKDDKGMVHVVKVGDYMGQNSGRIIAITPNQIRLTEIIPDGTGGWMQSRTTLTLVKEK